VVISSRRAPAAPWIVAWPRVVRVAILLLAGVAFFGTADAREITDMAGRKVVVPDRIERVWGSAPPLSVLLAMVAPDKMTGVNLVFAPEARRYLPPGLADLPVLGGVYGVGRAANAEEVLANRPQVALAWKSPFVDRAMVEGFFSKIGVPVVFVGLDTLADWPAAIRFTADLLGSTETSTAQADYIVKTLARVKATVGPIAEKDRVRVYYAEGPTGLATDCHRSFHTEAIELANGWNIHRCEPRNHVGMESISLEQIIDGDPQVILAQDPKFAAAVLKDPRWQAVRAVKDGRVYAVPQWPMNWLDRPPSAMRALGIQWLAQLFYPTRFSVDLRSETRDFYRLFLHVSVTDVDLDALVPPP
jgi:iron complex transport system substrate-binding protein